MGIVPKLKMNDQFKSANELRKVLPSSRKVDAREWWLWGFAIAVTLVLTFAIVTLTFPGFELPFDKTYVFNLREWVRGLTALVLVFDIYTVYQQLQLQRMRRQLSEGDEMFRLITDNAADMIAVVDVEGRRLYSSPAYEKILGFTVEELQATPALEQVHPEDRARVTLAAEKARISGCGERLEYRVAHKDGTWRTLESTANVLRDAEQRITALVIVNRDITDRKHAEELLAHNALYDGLTNLANRALLVERIGRAISTHRRHPDLKFAVLCIDIDGFKIVNDSLGHSAGDQLLIQIAQRLQTSLRLADTLSRPQWRTDQEPVSAESTLARPGGDEFVVLVEELRSPSDAILIAERIQKKLAFPFDVEGHDIVATASIGIALSGDGGAEPEGILRDAEIAMYRAKNAGKARWETFDRGMRDAANKRLSLESDIRKALERGEFRVHYQPILDLATEHVVGFEALSRWQRPEGMVSPADFIPMANETGIILAINQQLLREAALQVQTWQRMFPANPPLVLSVNVSPREFAQADLASRIGRVLAELQVDPRCIALEITETIAMADAERSAVILAELKHLGVGIDIDDFGTGYSSLSRLQAFRVDTLKIDRTFVSRIDTDRETYEIVRIVVTLAHTLGLKVVAEGIETPGQLELLRALGCEFGQGYFFAKPASEETIEAFLKNQHQMATSTRTKAFSARSAAN